MKKRVISLLLALIMALSLLPVSVLAADDHTGQVHVTVEHNLGQGRRRTLGGDAGGRVGHPPG